MCDHICDSIHNNMSNIKNWAGSILAVFSRQICNPNKTFTLRVRNRNALFCVVVVAVIVAVDNKEKGLVCTGQLCSTLT